VCDKCRKKISKLKCDASNKRKDDDTDSNEIKQFAKITSMKSLNLSLQSIGELPIKKKRLGEGKYPTSKMKRIQKAVKTRILNIPENINSSAVSPSPDAESLKKLKENFKIQRLQYFEDDNINYSPQELEYSKNSRSVPKCF
jgi:hypothetical protein